MNDGAITNLKTGEFWTFAKKTLRDTQILRQHILESGSRVRERAAMFVS